MGPSGEDTTVEAYAWASPGAFGIVAFSSSGSEGVGRSLRHSGPSGLGGMGQLSHEGAAAATGRLWQAVLASSPMRGALLVSVVAFASFALTACGSSGE